MKSLQMKNNVLKKLENDIETMKKYSYLPELQERLQFYKDTIACIESCEKKAFEGGWVARDSGGSFSEIDEWFETWTEDEARRNKNK